MAALLSGLWGRMAAVGATALGILLLLIRVRQSGRDAERAEQSRRTLDALEVRREVEDKARTAGPGAAVGRLRERWSRD